MPESGHKYLYERLGDHDFQQLVAALLASQFPNFIPMALRQADGGRDGLRKLEAGKVLIYQVKWSTSGKEKDPVTWLDDVVRSESKNLRRLAKEGVRRYMLVTNVASTAKPNSGTFDRLNTKLEEHAKAFGYDEMSCVWREALNPWVDNAPEATKWAYADMLAGWDLIRYLMAEQAGAAKDKGLRDLVRKVAATQWGEDQRVRFLYRNAGEDNPAFDSTVVLRELLRRSYWLNTARFYGGNAKGNAIYIVAAGIENELGDGSNSTAFIAAWTLLTDGVFQRRPREARRVLTALCADTGLPILVQALERRDIVALPELPNPPETDGPDPTWSRLTSAIISDPQDPANTQRARILRELLNQRSRFAAWWAAQLQQSLGTPQQRAWLKLAADCEGAAGLALNPIDLDLTDGSAELLLSSGAVPTPGSNLESALITAVLDRECSNVTSIRSLPAQLAVALTPNNFFTNSADGFVESDDRTRRRRADAISQLGKAGSPYAAVARERAFKAGQKGSTFPWANTAKALAEHAGRCWLASEIAIIGAASPHRLGYVMKPQFTAFGPTGHPCELLAQTRTNAGNATWWREQLATTNDELGHAEWALALWSVATGEVISELLPDWESVLKGLPESRRQTVTRASERIVQSGYLKLRPLAARTADDALATLIESRPQAAPEPNHPTHHEEASRPAPSAQPSLLAVARLGCWLKVDSLPAYR